MIAPKTCLELENGNSFSAVEIVRSGDDFLIKTSATYKKANTKIEAKVDSTTQKVNSQRQF